MIIRGREALESGALTPYELRTDFRRLMPGVFTPKSAQLTLWDRTFAAVAWSGHQGVVAGSAASALHRSQWVDPDVNIELIHANHRAPQGVLTRHETLLPGETTRVRGLLVTSLERTAFDLARRGPVVHAVQRLDALAAATKFSTDEVRALAARHPGVRGCRRVGALLDLVDAGAQSPQETWWRMQFLATGYPRPRCQQLVLGPGGWPRYYLDMAWPQFMVAAEYDGEQHRLDRRQYGGDIKRSEHIAAGRWQRIRIIAGDRVPDVCHRLEAAGLCATCEPPAILRQSKGVWR